MVDTIHFLRIFKLSETGHRNYILIEQTQYLLLHWSQQMNLMFLRFKTFCCLNNHIWRIFSPTGNVVVLLWIRSIKS